MSEISPNDTVALVYAELRKLPKRYKGDDQESLHKRLRNVMTILGGTEEELFPEEWEDTPYIYLGMPVGGIRFNECSIWIRYKYESGPIVEKRIKLKEYWEGDPVNIPDSEFDDYYGFGFLQNPYHLFDSALFYNRYQKRRGETNPNEFVPLDSATVTELRAVIQRNHPDKNPDGDMAAFHAAKADLQRLRGNK